MYNHCINDQRDAQCVRERRCGAWCPAHAHRASVERRDARAARWPPRALAPARPHGPRRAGSACTTGHPPPPTTATVHYCHCHCPGPRRARALSAAQCPALWAGRAVPFNSRLPIRIRDPVALITTESTTAPRHHPRPPEPPHPAAPAGHQAQLQSQEEASFSYSLITNIGCSLFTL